MSQLVRSVWVKRFLCFAFPFFLLAEPLTGIAQQGGDEKTHCVFSTGLVLLAVTVTDASGRPVPDLTHNDFFVTDRKKPQDIAFFSREDKPRSVAIVISESVAARAWLYSIVQNIRRFKEQSHEMSEYFIVAAGGWPQVITDWTREGDALVAGLNNLTSTEVTSGSAMYDACAFARQKLEERGTFGLVILLISEGEDSSQLSYTELRESFKRNGALVYSISLVDQSAVSSSQKDLKKLSSVSGGASYVVSTANEVSDVLGRIATELRHQYVIGYYPVDARHDGEWHPVKVMAHSHTDGSRDALPLVVRALSGYNAPNESAPPQHN